MEDSRIIRATDLTSFATQEIKDKIKNLQNKVVALSEENSQLKRRIAAYPDYERTIELALELDELLYNWKEKYYG